MTGTSIQHNKAKYRELCKVQSDIPLFCRDWWLDAVTTDEKNWDVLLYEKNDQIIASFPFVWRTKWGFKFIEMPKLTQHLGIWLKYPPDQKYATRLAFEKDIFTKLIGDLPKFDIFGQHFHYSFSNWLPFYWKGFEQTTRYTYVLENIKNSDQVFKGFRTNIRGDIRKAEKLITITEDDDLAEFFRLNKLVFERQGLQRSYSFEFLQRLDTACQKRDCRKIFFAKDKNSKVHAVLYLVWDQNSAYYLIGGSDPSLRNSGAISLLMWEAIKFAGSVTKKFDFEGSMIESIERFFRAFGAKQIPYFQISKKNTLAGLLSSLKNGI